MEKVADIVYSCSPCLEEGTIVTAIVRCVNCQENFCRSCVRMHNKILKSHTLVEKWDSLTENADDRVEEIPAVKCGKHPLELLKMFCENHDIVCCTVCIALDHRSCDKVHYIHSIAQESNRNGNKVETLEFMNDTEKILENILCQKQKDLLQFKKQRDYIDKKVENVVFRLISRIRELQKEILTNLETTYENLSQDLKNDITSLETSLNSLKIHKNKVENSGCLSNSHVFIQMKIGKSEFMKARKQFEMKNIEAISLDFEVNSVIESYFNEVDSIGNISTGRNSKASLIGEFDIGLQSDSKNPNIYGVCSLDNNEIVFADNSNLNLKRIGIKFQVLDTLDLGATPYGICKTGYSQVAVTLPWLHKIQFVSIGRKMVVNWAFKIDGICRGICCHDGNLYICCSGSGSDDPGQVIVSDMAGCLLKTFKTNTNSDCLFTSPQNVCFNTTDSYIHVADIDKGVVTVDQDGSLLSTTFDAKFSNAIDICVGSNAKLFLCGFTSNNIIEADIHSKVVHEILNKTHLSNRPLTVSFLTKPPRLVITSECSSVVKVFRLD